MWQLLVAAMETVTAEVRGPTFGGGRLPYPGASPLCYCVGYSGNGLIDLDQNVMQG